MSTEVPRLPPMPDEDGGNLEDENKVWIGNLDTRVTEFALLKLLQKFGNLKKFDFLYHKSGPDQGKPRGYCFVSYHTKQEASRAIQGLNGKLALSKKLFVRWAHAEKTNALDNKAGNNVQLLGSLPVTETRISKESKIRLIEEKLKKMESSSEEFSLDNGTLPLPLAQTSLDKRKTLHSPINQSKHLSSKPYSRPNKSTLESRQNGPRR